MLKLTIEPTELWDEKQKEFIETKKCILQLEHSLVSMGKWEMKHQRPFLDRKPKTVEETMEYIRCMTITQNVPDTAYMALTADHLQQVDRYIENPMTASTVREEQQGGSGESVTSELIYYWMISLGVPIEFQKWHLNRLLMLIRICNAKNKPPEKRSGAELCKRNAALNARRRAILKSKG